MKGVGKASSAGVVGRSNSLVAGADWVRGVNDAQLEPIKHSTKASEGKRSMEG